MNRQALGIINALLTLANSATYTCDLDGADKISALRQAARRTSAELEQLINEADDAAGDDNDDAI